ncbi:MAG: lipase [Gammaproteobacteria bacterium]|nr:lipase [Gammaproteobacteria bacterium]
MRIEHKTQRRPERSIRNLGLFLRITLALAGIACASGLAAPAAAASTGTVQLLATYGSVQYGWQQVELWQDTYSSWPQQQYLADGRDDQTGQRATFFGSAEPPGSQFLLYYAPGWNTGSHTTPVLLVMGAADNVDREFADPDLNGSGTCGALTCPTTGLMQYLSDNGYRVFAVNFANPQGDNYEWAQTIADAVEVIRQRTGATKVDVVAWSKGAFPVRMYVAGVAPAWGRPYQGDVRKLILLGGPNGGLDYIFAHGTQGDVLIYPECGGSLNGPSPHTDYMCYGIFYHHPELSIYATEGHDVYAGQRQMLARWDATYGVDQTQQDWYTTYYGGQGFVSYGFGIQYAIDHGSLVSTVQSHLIPTLVSTYLLCGGSADMPYFYNENRGPSDGLVFEASCLDTTGMPGPVSSTLVTNDNHLELGWESTAEITIRDWLGN